jgi:hypothetical protein
LGVDRVKVLDAYHGSGRVWHRVAALVPDVRIDVVGIDTRNIAPGVIQGDNRKILPTLDLTAFDLIDLDAYGVPAEQLAIVADRAPGVPVVATVIARHGAPPTTPMLDLLGIPRDWPRRSMVTLSFSIYTLWDHYCAALGYRTTYRTFVVGGMRKMYQVLN